MKRARAILSLALATAFAVFVLWIGFAGLGPLPPLGAAFNPASGVWTLARDAHTPTSETLRVPGLREPVTVLFSRHGTAYIRAQTDHDLFLAIGYLQAKNRLFQMDLMRRQGEGLLSQVIGPAALGSDKFELQLGLLRTARANWQALPRSSAARQALAAYAAGVNDVIRQDEVQGTLPVMFKLLNYRPAPWTPIDSLVVQGDMTQSLDYTTAPIEYDLLSHALGYQRTMAWFPLKPPNVQHPYDLGPYQKLPLAAMPSQLSVQTGYDLVGGVPTGSLNPRQASSAADSSALGARSARMAALADAATFNKAFRHAFSDSNNWAVSGRKTANGGALLAGDPHLEQTLPAIWYQIAGMAPGYNFTGVSIPGVPLIIIGHNQDIAWSLTNVQNQATFMYREKTSAAHPNQYFWKGAWRPMKVVHYSIPVKGSTNVPLTVRLTIHGPLMTQSKVTAAVDWIGALPSNDVAALMGVVRAKDFQAFKQALSLWHSPSQNFAYADAHGNIGIISAGWYAQTGGGRPWGLLSGTGAQDITGSVPYQAIPQAYNPSSGLVFSANQREVANSYPYYIGNSMDFFSTGYRADTIYHTLRRATHLTPQDIQRLQTDTRDYLAQQMVPELITALKGTPLTARQEAVSAMLGRWNGNMSVVSTSATAWWFFINQYLNATFGPWWKAYHVPVSQDSNLSLSATSEAAVPLIEDLQAWTAHDPENPAFSPPGGQKRSAPLVMRQAFQKTVAQLSRILGPNPQKWQWGRVHRRYFASLAQIPALGYGPRASGGDQWTVDAADGGLVAQAGPSWRMIVNWNGPGRPPFAEGVYPGGQSENPLSPWYDNQVTAWWSGRYYPMGSPSHVPGPTADWTLTP